MNEQDTTVAWLDGRGVKVHREQVKGEPIVEAFRRYLETGDSAKITRALYRHLQGCGYIAHYDIQGFRRVYDNPAKLLAGERYDSTWTVEGAGTEAWPVEHSQHVYTDGLTTGGIHSRMVCIAERMRARVERRSAERQRTEKLALARQIAVEPEMKWQAQG